jgi:hypothetical protein
VIWLDGKTTIHGATLRPNVGKARDFLSVLWHLEPPPCMVAPPRLHGISDGNATWRAVGSTFKARSEPYAERASGPCLELFECFV